MHRLKPQQSRSGLEFKLWWGPVPVPDDAPYREYRIDVRLPNQKGKTYKLLVRKAEYPAQALAEAFLLTDPLSAVKQDILDSDEHGFPIVVRQTRDDWQMY
jgi:hypothetical protein